MDTSIFSVSKGGPNIISTEVLEWRLAKILLKGRKPFGRCDEVVV